jgi:hypothetical protein
MISSTLSSFVLGRITTQEEQEQAKEIIRKRPTRIVNDIVIIRKVDGTVVRETLLAAAAEEGPVAVVQFLLKNIPEGGERDVLHAFERIGPSTSQKWRWWAPSMKRLAFHDYANHKDANVRQWFGWILVTATVLMGIALLLYTLQRHVDRRSPSSTTLLVVNYITFFLIALFVVSLITYSVMLLKGLFFFTYTPPEIELV